MFTFATPRDKRRGCGGACGGTLRLSPLLATSTFLLVLFAVLAVAPGSGAVAFAAEGNAAGAKEGARAAADARAEAAPSSTSAAAAEGDAEPTRGVGGVGMANERSSGGTSGERPQHHGHSHGDGDANEATSSAGGHSHGHVPHGHTSHSHGHASHASQSSHSHGHASHGHSHGHAPHAKSSGAASDGAQHGHGHSHAHGRGGSHSHGHDSQGGRQETQRQRRGAAATSGGGDARPVKPLRFDIDAFGRWKLYGMALGSSLAVSCASLIALTLIPVIFSGSNKKRGERAASDTAGTGAYVPSQAVVQSLSAFAVGALMGDALLHQLPHAYAAVAAASASGGDGGHGGHSHGHDHDHGHGHGHGGGGLSSALWEQRVGLSVMAGVLVFYVVERLVNEHGGHGHGHGHGHGRGRGSARAHAHGDADNIPAASKGSYSNAAEKYAKRKKDDGDGDGEEGGGVGSKADEDDDIDSTTTTTTTTMRRRPPPSQTKEADTAAVTPLPEARHQQQLAPMGYLNLIADGVHNFTDGMAIGAAFVTGGPVSGWSKTMFMLAHELPQEVGDYGILLQAGFGPFQAIFFNFLSALVALLGTALALVVGGAGGGMGDSAVMEGFTAGGFIYIAGAAMAEMQSQAAAAGAGGKLRNDALQVGAVCVGVAVCVAIHVSGGCDGNH